MPPQQPWQCLDCQFTNDSLPSECEECGVANPDYVRPSWLSGSGPSPSGAGAGERDPPAKPPLLDSFDIDGVAKLIKDGKARNVVVMCGAGISVSAGIPDFRTPGTGLYDNLQKYDLPVPSAVFELEYFKARPDAFYELSSEMWPGEKYKPTLTHHFINLLHRKGALLRCFSQNIDSLETAAGLPADKLVAAHGNFDSATCVATGRKVDINEVRAALVPRAEDSEGGGEEGGGGEETSRRRNAALKKRWSALADKHGGLVKPDIVFFGENLPERFFTCAKKDFPKGTVSVCPWLIALDCLPLTVRLFALS